MGETESVRLVLLGVNNLLFQNTMSASQISNLQNTIAQKDAEIESLRAMLEEEKEKTQTEKKAREKPVDAASFELPKKYPRKTIPNNTHASGGKAPRKTVSNLKVNHVEVLESRTRGTKK